MAESHTARVRLTGEGALGLTGEGTVTLSPSTIEIETPAGNVTMAVAAVDGVVADDRRLELIAQGRRLVLERAGDQAVVPIARELHGRARSLAGITRGLRSFGSPRAAPGAEHDRFFQPLMHARRRAERAADDAVRLAAFDGASLARAYQATVAELARARRPGMASGRRALQQELSEIAEPLFRACAAVSEAAAAIGWAEDDELLRRWREWSAAVGRLFAAADARWPAVRAALERPAPRRRSIFRRLVRLVGGA